MMTAFSLIALNGYFSMYNVHFILIKQVAKILCLIKSSPKVMSKSFWEKFQLILLLLNNGHMKNDFCY